MTRDPNDSGAHWGAVPPTDDYQPGAWRLWLIAALSLWILIIVLAVGTFGARGCS